MLQGKASGIFNPAHSQVCISCGYRRSPDVDDDVEIISRFREILGKYCTIPVEPELSHDMFA